MKVYTEVKEREFLIKKENKIKEHNRQLCAVKAEKSFFGVYYSRLNHLPNGDLIYTEYIKFPIDKENYVKFWRFGSKNLVSPMIPAELTNVKKKFKQEIIEA